MTTLDPSTWTDLANKALHDGQQAVQQAMQALLAAQTDLTLAQKAIEALKHEGHMAQTAMLEPPGKPTP